MRTEDLKLTADQERWWEHTRTAFIWQAPGWSHLMVSMLNPRQTDEVLYWSKDIENIECDGKAIVANPEWFFGLKLKVRVAAVGHVICHATLSHYVQLWRMEQIGHVTINNKVTLPFVKEIADIATDLVVNATLKHGKIGDIPEDWFYDDNVADPMTAWTDAYKKVYDKCEKAGGGGGASKGIGVAFPGKKPMDQHQPPGASQPDKSPEEAAQEREDEQIRWDNALSQALAITKEMRSYGKDAANQAQFFEKLLEPKIRWNDEIAAEFSRAPGDGGFDWMKADEDLMLRGIYAPARSGFGCNAVVVIMDSSGSIYGVKGLIDRFFGEMRGILDMVKPKTIYVVWCDARVQSTYVLENDTDLMQCYYEGAKGGGGTDFRPPFQWIEDNDITGIDTAVYMTDGDGSFPENPPPYPLIWADISGNKQKYPPWARVIAIPTDGSA